MTALLRRPAAHFCSCEDCTTVLVRAVRRACSTTLSNWAERDAIADELAKEAFVRDLDARLEDAHAEGLLAVGYPGRRLSWRAL